MALKQLDLVRPLAPVLIASWPGMGHVGVFAASYLRRKLDGQPYAEIDASAYYLPDAIDVAEGIGQPPEPPAQRLYYVKEPPVIIFEADAQMPGPAGIRAAGELLDAVADAGVKAVYTGAAFAMPMSFRQPSRVFGVASDARLRDTFAGLDVEPLKEGRISGLNGLLLSLAGARGMATACFLATMPHYALETPYPKASRALIQVFSRILNTTVDMTELDDRIIEIDKMLGEFEKHVADAISSLNRASEPRFIEHCEEPIPDQREERTEPHQLMERIEKMFEEAQRDRSKAAELKEELDRWGLFKLYEDRFLDIFARNGQ